MADIYRRRREDLARALETSRQPHRPPSLADMDRLMRQRMSQLTPRRDLESRARLAELRDLHKSMLDGTPVSPPAPMAPERLAALRAGGRAASLRNKERNDQKIEDLLELLALGVAPSTALDRVRWRAGAAEKAMQRRGMHAEGRALARAITEERAGYLSVQPKQPMEAAS